MKVCMRLSPLAAALVSLSPERASAFSAVTGWSSARNVVLRSTRMKASFGCFKLGGCRMAAADKRLFFSRSCCRRLSLPSVARFSADADDSDSHRDGDQDVFRRSRAAGELRILGVCGGIGSGKSLACQILVSNLGCAAHVDADKLSHDVYAPGSSALKEISEEFGSDVLQENGEINRNKLGSIVFADSKAMSVRMANDNTNIVTVVLSRFHSNFPSVSKLLT
uniref:Dephospho-CoA kinase n=1 Tax=Odontella aurita TaxID=265563 RepID=A0A7S4JP07_9STRA|mmetsp:Transcript_5040/g.14478  ORF Transcript_5040/g.14478 Transcript_5040/m.14478 type:complete len:223 (+) Transcript_5040:189-857(+)